MGHHIGHIVIALLRDSDHRRSLARNSIAQRAAFYRCQTSFVVDYRLFQYTEQQFDRIGTLQMNIASRVAAFTALNSYTQGDIALFRLHRLIVEHRSCIHTSGTTHIQLTFGLRIQIQQILALQPTTLEVERSVHTRFFINSEESLQRRMNSILVCQNSHSSSHTDTIVRTQRRAVGRYPFPVILYIGLDRIFLKIKLLVAILLRHHIHVSLQNHSGMILHTR